MNKIQLRCKMAFDYHLCTRQLENENAVTKSKKLRRESMDGWDGNEDEIQKDEGEVEKYILRIVDTDSQRTAAVEIHGFFCSSMNLDPTSTLDSIFN